MEAVDARLVAVGDPEYPPELLDLFDPPAGLFVRGRPLEELVPRVAMVGARNCSPVGREVAGALASGLARAGVCLVSGGARGIDAAAHQGALRAEGRTISVLGCGIDIVYPGENRDLLQDVVAAGAVVSEYPPGTPAEPFRFPARNRIVAALSRAVVVVEGATGSGSRITAEHALDLGREVFAVPGSVASPLAAIPLDLIRDGATLVRGPDDLLSDLGLSPLPSNRMLEEDLDPGGVVGDRSLQQAERMVWAALTAPSAPDALARAAGLSLPEVVSALVGLEIRGQVRQVGGRYERRLEGSA
jgi:DNA processing protein